LPYTEIDGVVIYPAIFRFLELYKEDENGDSFIDDLKSVGTTTVTQGETKKRKIVSMLKQMFAQKFKTDSDRENETIQNEFYQKFPCAKTPDYESPSFLVSNGKKFMKFKNNGKSYAIRFDDGLVFMWDGTTYKPTETIAKCPSNSDEGLNEQFETLPGQSGEQQNNQNNQQQVNQSNPRLSSGGNLLKRGSKGDEVVGIKMRLNKVLPNVIQDLEINTSDDNYNGKTVAAVAYFQAKNNLKVDGIVGPETRGELSKIQFEDTEGGADAETQA